jgi:DNA-binding response OmpR family regulator
MQPEDIPRALPVAVVIYGRDIRLVSDPAMLAGIASMSQRDARPGAQRALSGMEPAGSGLRTLSYGELVIDTAARAVTFGAMGVELRPREYDLLAYLIGDPTRVYTERELLRDIWGYRSPGATRTVHAHASRVRRALARAGAHGWVRSTRGVGYRLAP